MSRSTFRVLFYVNGSKEKDGIVPIMGRVTINGTVSQFSCKQSIPKALWDVKGNKAKGKGKGGTGNQPYIGQYQGANHQTLPAHIRP